MWLNSVTGGIGPEAVPSVARASPPAVIGTLPPNTPVWGWNQRGAVHAPPLRPPERLRMLTTSGLFGSSFVCRMSIFPLVLNFRW